MGELSALAAPFSAAAMVMPENERCDLLEAIEAHAAEWKCARPRPAIWPIVVRIEQDPEVSPERF